MTEQTPPPAVSVEPALVPPAETNSVPAPLPAPVQAPTNRISETWISFNRWSQSNGFGALKQISPAATPTYQLTTSNGVLVIRAGSRSAFWDGLDLRLGFAPQMIDGRPFVHSLDVQKSILPLINNATDLARTNCVIVIDPGHGGSNTGTRSIADGRWEKDFTLDWAWRLESLLATNGWQVFLTRTNDQDISLSNRVAFADQQRADFFLSLHFNSPGENGGGQAGLETYCLTPVGMASSLTRGYSDDPSQTFPNNAFDEQNVRFAVRLHHALLRVDGMADRGVRRARFLGVLRGQNRPAVLVEGGYLSNLKEARLIADPAHRQKLAEAIAKALTGEMETQERRSENGIATRNDKPPTVEPSTVETKNDQ